MRCASVTLAYILRYVVFCIYSDTVYARHRIFYVVEFNRGAYVCGTVYLQVRLQKVDTVELR